MAMTIASWVVGDGMAPRMMIASLIDDGNGRGSPRRSLLDDGNDDGVVAMAWRRGDDDCVVATAAVDGA